MLISISAFAAGPVGAAILAPILARVLGPDGRGQVAAILSPLFFADAIANAGMPAALTYFRAKGASVAKLLRQTSLALFLASSLSYLLLYLSAYRVSETSGIPAGTLAIIWLVVYLGLAIKLLEAIRLGERKWAAINLQSVAAPILRLAFCAAFLVVETPGPVEVACAYLLAGVLSATFLLRKQPVISKQVSVIPRRSEVLGYGMRAWVMEIGTSVNARIDQVVLAFILRPRELGLYAVAVTVAELPTVIYKAGMRVLFARTASGYSWEAAASVNRLVVWGSIALAIVFYGISAIAVPVVFGPDFSGAIGLIYLLLPSAVFLAGAGVLGAALSGFDRPGIVSATESIGVIVTVVGLLITVPGFGVQGAAIVSSVSALLVWSVRIGTFSYCSGVRWWKLLVLSPADVRNVTHIRSSAKSKDQM